MFNAGLALGRKVWDVESFEGWICQQQSKDSKMRKKIMPKFLWPMDETYASFCTHFWILVWEKAFTFLSADDIS